MEVRVGRFTLRQARPSPDDLFEDATLLELVDRVLAKHAVAAPRGENRSVS